MTPIRSDADRRDELTEQASDSSSRGAAVLRSRFRLLAVAFSLAMLFLVAISLVTLELLAVTSAYVQGESLYTKAQKRAVIALLQYAAGGSEFQSEEYAAAMAMLAGDRQARIALDQPRPDFDAATRGFIAGGNEERDVRGMVRGFRLGRHWSVFHQAIEIWQQADQLVLEMDQRAVALIEQVRSSGSGSPAVVREVQSLARLDRHLTVLEERFTAVISRIARKISWYAAIMIVMAGLAMIAVVTVFTRRQHKFVEQADRALRDSERRYRALVDQPNVGMWQIDSDGKIVFFNPAMRALLSLDEHESVTGNGIEQFVVPLDRNKVLASRRRRERGEQTTIEVGLQPRLGGPRRVLVHSAPIMSETERVTGHVGTCVDVTERKIAEEKLRYLAFYDPLTELGNRRMFTKRLRAALSRMKRHGDYVAVLYIDLDRFKVVNDAMGHATGDRLLREAARRLKKVVREEDNVARLGGDEFGMIIEDLQNIKDIETPAQRIVAAFDETFAVGDFHTHIGVSVGVAVSNGVSASELLRQADIAMYEAKRSGGRRWSLYDPEIHTEEEYLLDLESGLWHAAIRGEFVLHYQPIVELESGRIRAFEALVRWHHPEHGLLGPARFIPLAEETGAIVSIGDWVVDQVCRNLCVLRNVKGWPVTARIAINLSDAEFRHADPVARIRKACESSEVDPAQLQMEATESLLTFHPEGLKALAALGCAVSIDDFGTGYASLDRLREVDFVSIKVDRSFVCHLPEGRVDRAIVESIVHLGKRLDREVIAEGIETTAQREWLRELGCGFGQGFLFARPMPMEELVQFLADYAPERDEGH